MKVNEEVMGSLHYFFREEVPGEDHNNVLLYKTKRNIAVVEAILSWAEKKA